MRAPPKKQQQQQKTQSSTVETKDKKANSITNTKSKDAYTRMS